MTLAELRETVAVMRELGVRRFGEIELDAPPRAVVDRPAPLTPAEAAQWREDFGKGECSLGVLEGNLARRAPIPALTEEHKATRPPATPVPATPVPATNASRVAEFVARGYAKLSWDERNTFAALDRAQHDRQFEAWVAAGRPKG
jgi:hypothetical protein